MHAVCVDTADARSTSELPGADVGSDFYRVLR